MEHAVVPIVGLPADAKRIDGQDFHAVGDKYARAVAVAAHALPLLIPVFADLLNTRDLLDAVDGLLLTGSRSNVHPTHYGVAAHPEAEPYDEARDALTLPLIRAALEQSVPLLAICRGFQELNVALGGTLHARVHEQPGRIDHRRPADADPDVQYGPRHRVRFTPGGVFARLAGREEWMVNSLHWQGVNTLAPRLEVQGVAEDGTIEAVSVREAPGFALGVQWHPEYRVLEDALSRALFNAFGDAVRRRAAQRRRSPAFA